VIGAHTPEEFVKSLERPAQGDLLVKAGDPVDWTVNQIKPFMEEGDIIIDGGNSYFMDTERREKELKAEGFNFIGSGVSGGEKGALWGSQPDARRRPRGLRTDSPDLGSHRGES
jgi:6-phosphogluconate dehydrogenase